MSGALQQQSVRTHESLCEAVDVLSNPAAIDHEEQLTARLGAIEQVCSKLVQLAEGGGQLPTDLIEHALEAVSHGLGAARQHIEQAQGQLRAVQSAAWSQALLASADMCLHSERWHAAWQLKQGGGSKEAYLRTVSLVRDILKDGLLPLLAGATEQQSAVSGFCLAPQYNALLEMGRTAGEIVGMRDVRHRRPGLRNFSVLNALWNGIQRLWVAVPQEVQGDMERQDLGGARVLGVLLGFMRKDIRTCHQLLDPGMGKLLLYWAQKAGHVLGSCPAAGPACWSGLLEVPLCAQQELTVLAATGGGSAVALVEALRLKVLPNVLRLLVASLNTAAGAAEDELRVMLDALRMRLSAADQPALAVAALRTALHLLHSAPNLHALVRHHCVALFGAVMDALAGAAFAVALQSSELRRQVADAALLFLATCCNAATTAAGREDMCGWERQLMAQSWEACQQQLFLHALQPHPLTACVLGSVWCELTSVGSEALVKGHIGALHDLLHLSAAAEAGAGGQLPPSPLYLHLLELLAGLVMAAPPSTQDSYFANFLQVLPSMREDACQLACLAAELRLATLVDASLGAAVAAAAVKAALEHLYTQLMHSAPLVLKRLPNTTRDGSSSSISAAAEGVDGWQAEAAYLAWLLEALHCAVAYTACTSLHQEGECAALLATLCKRLLFLLDRTVVAKGVFAFAAPCLAMLRDLLALEALQQALPSGQREALVPVLVACQQHAELAAVAAALVPAVARCASPHAQLVQAVLSEQAPLLQHAGVEAYRLYAHDCSSEAVAAALPPSLRNSETDGVVDSFAALLRHYSQGCPVGSVELGEQEAAAWAAGLREEALGAAAGLRRALEAQRALGTAVGNGGTNHAGPSSKVLVRAVVGAQQEWCDGGSGDASMAAAVQEVMCSILKLESLVQGANGSAGTALDPTLAEMLRECSAHLAQLLGITSA